MKYRGCWELFNHSDRAKWERSGQGSPWIWQTEFYAAVYFVLFRSWDVFSRETYFSQIYGMEDTILWSLPFYISNSVVDTYSVNL